MSLKLHFSFVFALCMLLTGCTTTGQDSQESTVIKNSAVSNSLDRVVSPEQPSNFETIIPNEPETMAAENQAECNPLLSECDTSNEIREECNPLLGCDGRVLTLGEGKEGLERVVDITAGNAFRVVNAGLQLIFGDNQNSD